MRWNLRQRSPIRMIGVDSSWTLEIRWKMERGLMLLVMGNLLVRIQGVSLIAIGFRQRHRVEDSPTSFQYNLAQCFRCGTFPVRNQFNLPITDRSGKHSIKCFLPPAAVACEEGQEHIDERLGRRLAPHAHPLHRSLCIFLYELGVGE